ncbi:MAG: hypothetical protein DHS20C11_23620 [Lysobacteraceae bacterium]|nr:MAG: hypothetical protein DHS20C11_23620 [Xanthomonadaceae bacterium]
MPSRARLSIAALCVLCGLSWCAHAFDTGHHEDLTKQAMRHYGFKPTSIKIVQLENWLVDYFAADPLVDVDQNFRIDMEALHFDNLFSTSDVDQYWRNLLANLDSSISASMNDTSASSSERRKELLTVMGIALHAVQDFYTHSNWASFYPQLSDGSYRRTTYLSDGLPPDVATDGLYTGFYANKITRDKPTDAAEHGDYFTGMNKDSHIRPDWDQAYVFAYFDSINLIAYIKSKIDSHSSSFFGYMTDMDSDDLGLRETAELTLARAAAYDVSMLIQNSTQDGHYKGNLSGYGTEIITDEILWILDIGNPWVAYAFNLRSTLTPCLYDRNPGTRDCSAPPTRPDDIRFNDDIAALQVRIMNVYTSHGADDGTESDFYPILSVGDDGSDYIRNYTDRIIQSTDNYQSDAHPDSNNQPISAWYQIWFFDASSSQVPLRLKVFDQDPTWADADDVIDISSDGNNLDMTYTPSSQQTSGEVPTGTYSLDNLVTSHGGNHPNAYLDFYVTHVAISDYSGDTID